MSEMRFDTFPGNETEALAMLYVQNQDLSDLSPEEIYDKYYDAYQKIREHRKAKRESNRKSWAF